MNAIYRTDQEEVHQGVHFRRKHRMGQRRICNTALVTSFDDFDRVVHSL